jgi:Ca2+-binding RTX toxin-like protein
MNADGSSEVDLSNTPSSEESDPSWSPDGTRITYVAFPGGGGSVDVFVMGADGTGQTPLTAQMGHDLSPTWQPVPTCTVAGTGAAEELLGTDGPDVICGGGGDDVVRAGDGFDLVYGGAGNDVLEGQDGDDLLFGEGGDDGLDGGPGFDGLFGGPGTDACSPGADGAFMTQCDL